MEESASANNIVLHKLARTEFEKYLHETFSKYPTSESASVLPGEVDDDSTYVYNFDHPHRGLAVIINNETFNSDHHADREGSHWDENALKKSFERLAFHVEIFRNLKAEQMLLVAQAAAVHYGHQDADCLVMAILTHGGEMEKEANKKDTVEKWHVLYGVDGEPVLTKTIVDSFSDNNCPSLYGKPRLFFIQASRGEKFDDGVRFAIETSSSSNSQPRENLDKVTIRPSILYPDTLIMYATPPGYLAWTRESTGSWFIQELCKFLDSEEIGGINLVHGLTSVCRKVALQYESRTLDPGTSGKKGMPIVESQLLNDIFMTRHKEQ